MLKINYQNASKDIFLEQKKKREKKRLHKCNLDWQNFLPKFVAKVVSHSLGGDLKSDMLQG